MTFKLNEIALDVQNLIEGKVMYQETIALKNNGGKEYQFSKNDIDTLRTEAKVRYSFDMLKSSQTVAMVFASVSENMFSKVEGNTDLVANLFKATAIDLNSKEAEELKMTDVEKGITIDFTELGPK